MLYTIIKGVARFLFLFSGLKVEGLNNLPRQGAVIVAANHVSFWDPVIVAMVAHRPVHYIAKAELFNNKILGTLFNKLNAFPVKIGTPDRKAIRYALHLLEEGKVLGIFPEGTRNRNDEDMKAASGIALFALKSGAPVVPVACRGTKRYLPWIGPRPFVIRFGPAVYFDSNDKKMDSATLEKVSNDIMNKINSLLVK